MIHLEPRHLKIVRAILKKHLPQCEVLVFGSRVHGRNLKPFSDVDLAILADKSLEAKSYAALMDAFSESDLPFKVDLLDFSSASPKIRRLIQQNHEVILSKKSKSKN